MTKSRTIATKKGTSARVNSVSAKAALKATPAKTRTVKAAAHAAPVKPAPAKPTAAKIASVKAASSIQAERERKAQEQHDAWVAKANTIAASLGVVPLNTSGVDFRIAYAKTLRRD